MLIFKPVLTGLILLLMPALAAAQNFPNQPIKMIVPFPAGGPNDIIARVIAPKMSELLKQSVVVENRAGQGGVVGTDVIARAKPDGYTIALSSAGALAISPNMEKVPYDTLKDFQPITLVGKVPEMMVVAPNVPVKDVQELIALAKSQPGKLQFASTGLGSLTHLAGEMFKLSAKVDMIHVPYSGAAPAINDVLGGRVTAIFLDLPVLLPHIESGKLKALALGTTKRVKLAPNVPTTAEVGMPELLAENWYGIVAPAGTPPDVVAALNKAAVDSMKDPGNIEKLLAQGVELVPQTPDEFRTFIDSEMKKWGKVVKDSGVPVSK
jgi:tripartite-type tricarboxylate transporter receptor subunit TctC